MKRGLISVIVPIYNGKQYLNKLIDSLFSQTYTKYEVYFVEDHSTDESREIIVERCKGDDRFNILYPQEKLGKAVSGQVYALPYCQGEYHFFMSQDDFIDDDFFENCINVFTKYGADVVIPNCILYDGKENKKLGIYPKAGNYELLFEPKDAFVLSLNWEIHGFTMEKMSLFKAVGLDDCFYNSEEYYKRVLFLQARNIRFADTNFYYRQDNPNAITKGRKYFHIDVLTTDFKLYQLMINKRIDIRFCKRQLKRINIEYIKWIYRGIKYSLYKENNFYFVKAMRKMFFSLLEENIKLLLKRK